MTLARWAAPGRKASKDGLPIPRDLRELTAALGPDSAPGRPFALGDSQVVRLLGWARDTEMIELRRHGFVAGPRFAAWSDPGATTDDEVLSLWDDLFTLAERQDPLDGLDHDVHQVLAQLLPPRPLPTVMVVLYRAAGGDNPAIDAHTLGATLFGQATARLPVPAEDRRMLELELELTLAAAVVLRLADLMDHGVIASRAPAPTRRPPPTTGPDPAGGWSCSGPRTPAPHWSR